MNKTFSDRLKYYSISSTEIEYDRYINEYLESDLDLEINDDFRVFTSTTTAPILVSFVIWTLLSAKKKGVSKIYFLARDGKIMMEIAKIINNKFNLELEIKYLFCSRLVLKSALMKLNYNQFIEQLSLGQLKLMIDELEIENIEKSKLKDNVAKCQGEWESFFNTSQYCEHFVKLSHDKCVLLQEYFLQEGLYNHDEIAFVDSGWKGSMQANIVSLLNGDGEKKVPKCYGFYFGITHRDTPNSEYNGFFYSLSKNFNRQFDFNNNVFEAICAANHGMTVGYNRTNRGIVPDFRLHVANGDIEDQENIIKSFTNILCKSLDLFNLNMERLSDQIEPIVKELMNQPKVEDITHLARIDFDSSIVEKELRPLVKVVNFYDVLNYFLFSRILKNKEHNIHWLAGSLVYSKKGFVKLIGSGLMILSRMLKNIRMVINIEKNV